MVRNLFIKNAIESGLRNLKRVSGLFVPASFPAGVLLAATAFLTPTTAHANIIESAVTAVGGWAAGAVGGVIGTMLAPIALVMLTISNFILWIAGLVFNWAVIRTVYQFGEFFGTSSSMLVAWGIMRDVANIGLLFSFIFMGVLLILNVEGGGHGHGGGLSAKKAIPRLIIFAVLLNFSLFTTQAIIDVSNGVATVFAEQAGQKGECTGASTDDCVNIGIAGIISDRAGIFSVWKDGPNYFTNPLKAAVVYVGLSIFVMITAMVLIAGSVMFVYRAVVLSFLMITSPIGFAGMAIPSLKKIGDEWWSKLISQAFFAPVYLLLIFISLKLTETLSSASSGSSLASALAGTEGTAGTAGGNVQVVLVFAVVIGFMMASLVTANKMGAIGAKFATKTAASVTFGAAGFAGRRTVGRATSKYAEKLRGTEFGHSAFGQLVVGGLDAGGKASFDMRDIKGVKGIGGIETGEAQKGGYEAIVHHGQEQREKYAKSLTKTDADKAREETLKNQKVRLEDEREGLGDTAPDKARKKEISREMRDLDQKLKDASAAPQLRYAENLHKGSEMPWNKATAGGRASHHAVDAIKKTANKDKLEKVIQDYASSSQPKAAPAAAPAAPAGGAAPAAGGDHH